MIANGIPIDLFSLLRVKVELLRISGFTDVDVVPHNNGQSFHVTFSKLGIIPRLALPCIHDLPTLLDAPYPFRLPSSAMGGPLTDDDATDSLLVGSVFVDFALAIFCGSTDLGSLSTQTVKAMLESIIIIINKHDLESRPLRYLQSPLFKAVRRAMELVSADITYEIRQLALSVTQSFVTKWQNLGSSFISFVLILIFLQMASLMVF
jgi:hypothetical protein